MHDHLATSPENPLYADLEDMYEFSPAERFSFVRNFMESDEPYELPRLTDETGIHSHFIQDTKSPDGSGTRAALLPDVRVAKDQLFTRLEQCKIVEIDTAIHRPYLRANLSVCSIVVARDATRLWAAHLGMSEETQMRHAIEQLQQRGFSTEDCTVIASVGPTQEANNRMGLLPRLSSISDYEKWGFNPATISPFSYLPPQSPDDRRHQNLCEVIIGPDGMLTTTFDADMSMQHGFMRETIIPETVKETFIAYH